MFRSLANFFPVQKEKITGCKVLGCLEQLKNVVNNIFLVPNENSGPVNKISTEDIVSKNYKCYNPSSASPLFENRNVAR